MKVCCVGARFHSGQVERIEKGFEELGHTLTQYPQEADLVYSNDTSHCEEMVTVKRRGAIWGKTIITVLDIPEHLFTPEKKKTIIDEFQYVVQAADAVTVISTFVQGQVKAYLGRESAVVYNPIKPITRKPNVERGQEIRFLSAGRRYDGNKRHAVAVRALQSLGINYGQLALVGEEYMPWGEHFGPVTDDELNKLYNSVDFVIATGRIEGLGLPALEAAAAGVIPILCNDLSTRQEFFPSSVFPEYDKVDPTPQSVAEFVGRYIKDRIAMVEFKERLYKHFQKEWAEKLSGKGVAGAILRVYEGLKAEEIVQT